MIIDTVIPSGSIFPWRSRTQNVHAVHDWVGQDLVEVWSVDGQFVYRVLLWTRPVMRAAVEAGLSFILATIPQREPKHQ